MALSRGRESNRLYVVTPAAGEREEYAPVDGRRPDARAVLIDGLRRSRAQTLATDVADTVPSAAEELMRLLDERRRLELTQTGAQLTRRRLDQQQSPWYRPGARRRHAAALQDAAAAGRRAAERLVELRAKESVLRGRLALERVAQREVQVAPDRSRSFPRRRSRHGGWEIGR